MDTNKIFVTINHVDKSLYSGWAKSLSSFNDQGPFDVLVLHANFISIIKKKVIVHEENGENKEFIVESGILKVADNKASVYVGLAMEKSLLSNSGRKYQ